MAETIRPIEAYVDDIDAVLGCMRQDKKINVFFIPLEKYFYVISERWSGWRLFGDGLSNRLPKKGYGDKGAWYTALTIKYKTMNGYERKFTFSTLYPKERFMQKEFDLIFPRFSLRAGYYEATLVVRVYEDLGRENRPVNRTITSNTVFYVPEEGDVPLFYLLSIGAKYNKYDEYEIYSKKWIAKVIENLVEDRFMQLTPDEAAKYYEWWKSVYLDIINVVPAGEPWGFTQPKPAATAAPKPAPKPAATAAPKPAPKPAATAAPKPAPKPAATAAPKSAPKPAAIPPAIKPIAHERPKIEPLKCEQPKITPLKKQDWKIKPIKK